MNNDEQTPAAEPEAPVQAAPEETPPPEAPSGTIREQILALVPQDQRSQVASLLDSLVTHTPPPSEDKKDESPVVKKKYAHLPFRPRITREETKREASTYGSLADD